MSTLRRFLTKSGYDAQGWGLGRNVAGRDWRGEISELSEGWAIGERDRKNRGKPVALVGWSLGGFLAREAARDFPAHVSGVITLGSPLTGGPKYTFVNGRYKRRGSCHIHLLQKRRNRPLERLH